MDRDTLGVVERIIEASRKADVIAKEAKLKTEKMIGSAISYVVWHGIDDPRTLSRDILLKFLCFECYEAYKSASDQVIAKFKDNWYAQDVFHPKSTRQILEFPFELNEVEVVPFIRFLYEFTDEPWRVYAALEDIF